LHWEWKPLREGSFNYAAIDGYLSYNIYARLRLYTLRTAHLGDKIPAPLTDRESSGRNWKKTWSDDDDEPPVAWKNAHNVPLVSKWKDRRNRRSANKSSYSNWEKPQPLGVGVPTRAGMSRRGLIGSRDPSKPLHWRVLLTRAPSPTGMSHIH
jgi:hypothetical protein